MRINTSTDYAVRMLLCLAKESKPMSSSKLAAIIGVSSRYLLQISAKLRDAGLIVTTHGPAGGVYLCRNAGEINLYDVISVMEGRIGSISVLGRQEEPAEFKILNTAYEFVNTVLVGILKNITIESLLGQSIESWNPAP